MELVVALIITLVSAPIIRRVAIRLQIVDRPGPLKTHRSPVPYLGGVAVFLGVLVGPIEADRLLLLLPYGLALALGVTDDVRGLTPQARLGAEILVGVVAALAVPGPPLAKIGTAVLVVVLLNAVNLLDGQDGLAAGAGLVSAAAFAILGGDADHDRARTGRCPGRVPRLQRAAGAHVPRRRRRVPARDRARHAAGADRTTGPVTGRSGSARR